MLSLYDENLEKQYLSLVYLEDEIDKKIDYLLKVDGSSLYVDEHKKIFEAYKKLLIDKKAVSLDLDMVSKETEIKVTSLIKTCCFNLQYSPRSIIKQLLEVRNLRELQNIKKTLSDINLKSNPKMLIHKVIGQINSILKRGENQKSIRDIVIEGKKLDKIKRMKSGIKTLDKITRGLAPTQIWVFGGRYGVGKSLWALQFTIRQLFDGKKVAFFSTELANWLTIKRMQTMIIGLGMIVPEDIEEWVLGLDDRLFLIDNKSTIEGIQMTIRAIHMKYKLDLVVIDHLHNIFGEEGEEYSNLVKTVQSFQDIAKELEVGMLLMSQLKTDAVKNIEGPEIGFRGGQKIAEVADLGVIIHRQKLETGDDDEVTNLIIKKNRHGPCGCIVTKFNIDSLTFSEEQTMQDEKEVGKKIREEIRSIVKD